MTIKNILQLVFFGAVVLASGCVTSHPVTPDGKHKTETIYPVWAQVESEQSLSHFVKSRVTLVDTADYPQFCYEDTYANKTQLLICGVTNTDLQERLLSAVREWQMTNKNTAVVIVSFYRSGGYYEGIGLPPVVLREVVSVLTYKQLDNALYHGGNLFCPAVSQYPLHRFAVIGGIKAQ